DGDACTTDQCNAGGVCENPPIAGCVSCATDGDCADGSPCTREACGPNGSCEVTAVAGCVRCTTVAQCADEDVCTADVCAAGVCRHDRIDGCQEFTPTAEICTDGVDNDCDQLVDCADPNCAASPACAPPPKELCGNCIDDDGDGLVDY